MSLYRETAVYEPIINFPDKLIYRVIPLIGRIFSPGLIRPEGFVSKGVYQELDGQAKKPARPQEAAFGIPYNVAFCRYDLPVAASLFNVSPSFLISSP